MDRGLSDSLPGGWPDGVSTEVMIAWEEGWRLLPKDRILLRRK
jgi:hypothetical protein